MRVRVLLSLSFLSMTLAGAAAAHVDLTYPPARSLGSTHGQDLKGAPCGQAANMRTAMVTSFTPGQMVDIKIEEYVDHTGYYAVSFDNDGDNDFPYPRAGSDDVNPNTDAPMTSMPIGDKVLGYHFDAEVNMNCYDLPNRECTIKVQIPNVPCQNCTLQVIQFMYDKTGDGQPNEQYYQCADIKIEGAAGGSGGAGGGGAGGGAGGVATAGSGGAGGTPGGGVPATGGVSGSTVGGSSAGTPSGGTGTAGTAPIATSPPADAGGCSITRATGQAGSTAALAAGLLVAFGWLGRRQKRAR